MDTADLSADQLATCGCPAEQHAGLRERGVHSRDGEWIVARPADVTAALESPVLTVAPTDPRSAPPAGDAKALQTRWARFGDGAAHGRARGVLEQLLPDATGLETAAARRTAAVLRERSGAIDAMALARTVPVEVLAEALEVPPVRYSEVAALVGLLCEALAPWLGRRSLELEDGDLAARELMAILTDVEGWDSEQCAAVAGLLFQARDATAALIGAAVLNAYTAADRDPADSVEWALRHDAPVQCTRRTAVEDVVLGGETVPRGASVWVVLAAAEHGPPQRPATFGSGPHGCPGAAHATALATGVLTALRTGGWQLMPQQPVAYEPRPNLRMPAVVLLEQPSPRSGRPR